MSGESRNSELLEAQTVMKKDRNDEIKCAVKVCNVCYAYGPQLMCDSKRKQVLNNCCINVPKGHIYALLGPNGSGKTTLIRCIIDRIRPHFGSITLLGVDSKIIMRKKIGYMPQDISICIDFTIEENLRYFARLYGMTDESITSGISAMQKLLNLPEKSRFVSKLSEGQKRRVSLSIALMHSPMLVILDEPTVGVDPTLRRVIWDYMHEICVNRAATIIITTHYIEEARSAANVAFIRNGRILEQQSPETLLNKFGCNNLESVFLKLCQISDTSASNAVAFGSMESNAYADQSIDKNFEEESDYYNNTDTTYKEKLRIGKHIRPLLKKHLRKLIRYKVFASLFLILFPAIFVLMFFLVTSRMDDIHFDISIYNEDTPPIYSHQMIDILEANRFINTIHHTKSSAIESVIDGRSVAALIILQNYSNSFAMLYGPRNTNDSFVRYNHMVEKAFFENKRCAKIYIDISKQQGFLMLSQLLKTYSALIRWYLSASGQNPEFISLFDDTWVYGNKQMINGEDLIGSVLSLVIFIVPLLLISNSIIAEKKEGILERSLSAGVQIFDYFFTHLVIRVLLLTGKVVLALIAVYPLVGEVGRSNFVLLSTMLFMQGLSGISFGLLVSIVSKDDITMALILSGSLIPILLLSGILWPLESLPPVMRYISYVLPLTTTSGAMSSIVNRGWGLDHYEVWIGYVVSVIYTSLYIAIAYVSIKFRILVN